MLKKLYAMKNKKGFTLVELMVVVAILGILVAVAVPVYNNVTENARTNACVSNIRTIQSAIEQAQIDGKITSKTATYTVAQLVTDGYLAAEPFCPTDKASKYSITITAPTGEAAQKIVVECTSADKADHVLKKAK